MHIAAAVLLFLSALYNGYIVIELLPALEFLEGRGFLFLALSLAGAVTGVLAGIFLLLRKGKPMAIVGGAITAAGGGISLLLAIIHGAEWGIYQVGDLVCIAA